MSGYYNNYEARPSDVSRALDGSEAVVGAIAEALAAFDSAVQGNHGWNGRSDNFFQETNSQYLEQNEGIRQVLTSLKKFQGGLNAATRESLRSIGLTQGAVKDMIDEAMVNGDNYTNGGHGKR